MDKLLSMIGLAYKAGKVKFGQQAVLDAVRSRNKPYAVVLSSNAAENAVKKITDSCLFHSVRLLTSNISKEELGYILKNRSEISCIAIIDEGFANVISNLIGQNSTEKSASSGGNLDDK